jgi:hypothetical protein
MSIDDASIKSRRLRITATVLAVLLLAVLTLVISEHIGIKWLSTLLNELGSILIASTALALVFDYWQKEAFFNDLFRQARIATQVRASGLVGFSLTPHDKVDWDDLFGQSTKLDVFFVYGSTWRHAHRHRVVSMLTKRTAKLRAMLPDPASSDAIDELARRFRVAPDDLVGRIRDAIEYFDELGREFPDKVEVILIHRSLVFSFYRFDGMAVLALYKHQGGRGGVPTLLAERGGSLYDFVRDEWDGIVREESDAGTLVRHSQKTGRVNHARSLGSSRRRSAGRRPASEESFEGSGFARYG